MHSLIRLAEMAERVLRWIVMGLGLLMVALVLAQVASRYFFRYPLGWTEELARICMVWWTFLGVGMLAAKGRLLSVDAALLALRPRVRFALQLVACLLAAISMAWLAFLGWRLVELAGTQVSPALRVPYLWIYLSLPVGSAISALALLVHAGLNAVFMARGHGPVAYDMKQG